MILIKSIYNTCVHINTHIYMHTYQSETGKKHSREKTHMFLVKPCWLIKIEDARMGPLFTEQRAPGGDPERREARAEDRASSGWQGW